MPTIETMKQNTQAVTAKPAEPGPPTLNGSAQPSSEATRTTTKTDAPPPTPATPPTPASLASSPPTPPATGAAPSDPFDPSKLTLKQDFATAAGVKKIVTMVPVRKPNKFEWVWVHSDPAYQLTTAALVYKEDREEVFLVEPRLWPLLGGELRPIALFTTMNRQGVLSLWPVKLPGPDGRHDSWNASALDAVGRAKAQWTRVVADMSLGGYNLFVAGADLEPPQWPELSFKEILGLAFRGHYIDNADHLVIKKLRGEA